MKYAILIDGGFLKKLFGSWVKNKAHKRIQAESVCELANSMGQKHAPNHELLRIYYYDSPPVDDKISRPISGSSLNLGISPVHTHQKKLLADLKQKDFVAVREGTLMVRGWKLSRRGQKALAEGKEPEDAWFEPNIQQKGVDTKIGLDMAWIAFCNVVDRVVMVTGDSDFVPAIKAARRNGVQVILCTLGNGISGGLRNNVDVLDESFISHFITHPSHTAEVEKTHGPGSVP